MQEIKKLLESMNHTIRKNDVLEHINVTMLSLNNEVIPMVDELLKLFDNKNNLSMERLPELSNLNRDTFKSKDIKSFVNSIYNTLKNLNSISGEFIGVVDKEIPDLLGRDVCTIKQAYILNIITNITNFTLYSADIVLYIINLIDNKINDTTLPYIKFKLMEIRTDISKYGKLLMLFKDSKTLISEIGKLSKDRLLVDSIDNGTINMISSFNKSKIPLVMFIGNPIYHVKMWLVDRTINKYEILKEKKKLTELKILELKARQAGENDPKIRKAIEYHEDKLEAIEYKIRKIEEK